MCLDVYVEVSDAYVCVNVCGSDIFTFLRVSSMKGRLQVELGASPESILFSVDLRFELKTLSLMSSTQRSYPLNHIVVDE